MIRRLATLHNTKTCVKSACFVSTEGVLCLVFAHTLREIDLAFAKTSRQAVSRIMSYRLPISCRPTANQLFITGENSKKA
jgi:hypothetical protein